jgi:hypothetical protein
MGIVRAGLDSNNAFLSHAGGVDRPIQATRNWKGIREIDAVELNSYSLGWSIFMLLSMLESKIVGRNPVVAICVQYTAFNVYVSSDSFCRKGISSQISQPELSRVIQANKSPYFSNLLSFSHRRSKGLIPVSGTVVFEIRFTAILLDFHSRTLA